MSKLEKLVDDLSSLTVIEAADLSKLLEEKWGVSAAAPVAMAAVAGGAAAPVVEEPEEAVKVEAELIEEPEKRKPAAKPTAIPKKTGSLASVVADWDADDE